MNLENKNNELDEKINNLIWENKKLKEKSINDEKKIKN